MVCILDTISENEESVFDKNKIAVKKQRSKSFKTKLDGIKNVLKNLEISLSESDLEDKQLLRQLQLNNILNLSTANQLNEARKENKQLLNILQQKYEQHSSRSNTDFSSTYSTMSMVNLQYKYEELLGNYENLLKLLASKDKEVQKLYKESDSMIQKTSEMSKKLLTYESILKRLCVKHIALKEKKELRIDALTKEKETLLLAHNQLVKLLNNQYMDNNDLLTRYLQESSVPQRAMLLREVKRANNFEHQNMLLTQEIGFIKSYENVCNNCGTVFNWINK